MRARLIKPDIVDDEDLAELSIEARYLFLILPMMADREGRLEYRPARIRAKAFPYENSCNVAKLLEELASFPESLLKIYDKNGTTIIQLMNFRDTQSPHKNEPESKLPAFDSSSDSYIPTPEKYGALAEHSSKAPNESSNVPPIMIRSDPDQDPDREILEITKNSTVETDGSTLKEKKETGKRLPDDWEPDEDLLNWAIAKRKDIVLDDEILKFKNHWKAKTGKDATKLDWRAIFQNWIMGAKPTIAPKTGFSSTLAKPLTEQERFMNLERVIVKSMPNGEPHPLNNEKFNPRHELSFDKDDNRMVIVNDRFDENGEPYRLSIGVFFPVKT